jgi:hypothetical protein
LRHCNGLQTPNRHCAEAREGRSEVKTRSQDTDLVVLVAVARKGDQLLRKEKDEASPPICFWWDSLDAFIPRFAGVWRFFYFQTARWSLKPKPSRDFFRGTN